MSIEWTRALAIPLLTGVFSCGSQLSANGGGPEDFTSTTIEAVSFDAVYVVNGESSSITVINAQTNEVAGTIQLKGVEYPHHISLSADRSQLAVAIPGYDMSEGEFGHEHHSGREGKVALLDASTGALRRAMTTNAANNNVVFAPGGDIWTSQMTMPGSTLILDPGSLRVSDAITVGTSPTETTMTADGKLAFVSNSGSSSVSVIDVTTRQLKATIPIKARPVLAQPSPDGLLYVENEPDKSVSVVDLASLSVIRTFTLDNQPGYLTATVANEVWVTTPADGKLRLYRSTGEQAGSVVTGKGAHYAVVSPDNTRIYVSNQWENTVSVVDRATLSVTKTIPVGAAPNGMVWRSR